MKTALWLYLFLFIAFFDLHAQYPILTPFAISLGAAPTFIGWMMGIYSLTHLPGNLMAGPMVDKHGSRRYIMFSLTAAGIILIIQSYIHTPWELLFLRAISGFVLAFLSPACLAMLAQLSDHPVTQGKYMSGHGVVHTLASVLSPAAGAFIVASFGFSETFSSLGIILVITGLMAYFTLPKAAPAPQAQLSDGQTTPAPLSGSQPLLPFNWRYLFLPFVLACAQGILFYEIPLRNNGSASMMSTGLLFSIISLGALCTLSLLFLNKYSPMVRLICGIILMSLSFYALAIVAEATIGIILFILGTAKGIIFPALASLFIRLGGTRLGKTFALQSIATSIGSFAGPVLAGQLPDDISPFFVAFLILMLGLLLIPVKRLSSTPPLSAPGPYHPS
ncbi:MFS transporter [Paenibacillus kribbensis]|uniref:MFS transporter n=1 Tax=Paenibacillus kribbensis TaxID=172713 RepID=UPI002DB6776B|nr:MFS transporter [Paenibacillus kribbensis]MEC0237594.1 MFS transporter [Paenibacillus kribbensis]